MTREPHDPDLATEQEREVRRLLAEARHAAPIPEDVAARLDGVLADLATGDHPTPVASLATHRRRRAVTMLVAAAAVVVAGVGLGQVVGIGGHGGTQSPTASRAQPHRDVSSESAQQDATGSSADTLGDAGVVDSYDLPTTVAVRAQHFSADVRHARRLLLGGVRGAQPESQGQDQATEGFSATGSVAPCAQGAWGAGRLVPATYAGQQAVLVFRAVAGDSQVVDLFACGSDVALRSITLPAP